MSEKTTPSWDELTTRLDANLDKLRSSIADAHSTVFGMNNDKPAPEPADDRLVVAIEQPREAGDPEGQIRVWNFALALRSSCPGVNWHEFLEVEILSIVTLLRNPSGDYDETHRIEGEEAASARIPQMVFYFLQLRIQTAIEKMELTRK